MRVVEAAPNQSSLDRQQSVTYFADWWATMPINPLFQTKLIYGPVIYPFIH